MSGGVMVVRVQAMSNLLTGTCRGKIGSDTKCYAGVLWIGTEQYIFPTRCSTKLPWPPTDVHDIESSKQHLSLVLLPQACCNGSSSPTSIDREGSQIRIRNVLNTA